MVVKKGSIVKFHLTGKLDNNEVFGSTIGGNPIEYKIGEENIIKGAEEGLMGMKEGEKKKIVIPPEKGYGLRDKSLVQKFSKDILKGKDLKKGQTLKVQSKTGEITEAMIADIESDGIVLDFNHPFAGRTIKLDVEIVQIH